jgi:hypothetical protein
MKRASKTPGKKFPIDINALACGISGPGALVVLPGDGVHALQPGESIWHAWSNVGRRLEDSFAKLANERKDTASGR